MTRTLAAAVDSYLSEPVQELRVLARITLSTSTMRVHTGVGSLMVGATHYDGIGAFGGVEQISESPNNMTSAIKMWLSAVNSAALNDAVTEQLFGKSVELYRAWLRDGTLVNTPEQWYRGMIGAVDVYRGDPDRGNYIEVSLQTKMDRRYRPTYYTKEDLALTYSGDTFFNYTHQIPQMTAMWGQRPTRFSNYAPVRRGRFPIPI